MRLEVATRPPYPVSIGPGLLGELERHVPQAQLALITDSRVAGLYGGRLRQRLAAAGRRVSYLVVPEGENSKSLEVFGRLLRSLAEAGLDRGAAAIALGGGMVGDLAGFVAASYMRGLALYQAPTSLLAMVDASVGGKTAINLPEGKNLVGAFWQPKAVVMDTETLRSLPERGFRQGAVELFKAGLLADPSILEEVPGPGFRPDGPAELLASLIGRAVAVKAALVAADEREAGKRAHLNLGHTLAHALEARTGHAIGHGEAVALGLVFMSELSRRQGFADETERVARFAAWVGPRLPAGLSFDQLRPYIGRDKKNLAGRQRWVLLQAIGEPVIVEDLPDTELLAAWRYLQERAAAFSPLAPEVP